MISSFKFLDEACKERSFRGSRVMLIREKGYLSYFVLMNNEKGWHAWGASSSNGRKRFEIVC